MKIKVTLVVSKVIEVKDFEADEINEESLKASVLEDPLLFVDDEKAELYASAERLTE